jgi:hypothetical protein
MSCSLFAMGKIVKKGSMQGRYQWFEPVILNYAGG